MYKDAETRREYRKKYYRSHREQIVAYQKKWEEEHPVQVAKYRVNVAMNRLKKLMEGESDNGSSNEF